MKEKPFYKQRTLPGIEPIAGKEIPSLPHRIGPYKIEGFLAKGGMSLLYLAVHPETKQSP